MGGNYILKDLEKYNNQIEALAGELGLNCYPQEFEICSYEDMLGYEAYLGMPSRYPHWSFGKAYERKKTFYRYNLTGLPYEMVINSNPCLAYLMKDNTLLLQILTIAHVYGHNDFFKNNRLFAEGTKAEYTLEMFKTHAKRIREYITDPSIGYAKVERILDAAHSIRLQTYRIIGEKHLSSQEVKAKLAEKLQKPLTSHPLLESSNVSPPPDINRFPLQPEEDLLLFLSKYAPIAEWEKDILFMVREESLYFLPQIETKIMNEGWASYWHYTILNKLGLSADLHLEFLKRHNQVVSAHEGSLNPYHLGFKIFSSLADTKGRDFIFQIRQQERDVSFIQKYLSEELCNELNLFEYRKSGKDYIITEITDEEGWKAIRQSLVKNCGINMVPVIKIVEVEEKNGVLMLEHEWDGRDLQSEYAQQTLKQVANIWGRKIRMRTRVKNSYQIIEVIP